MTADRKTRALAVAALLLSVLALGGCATSIADLPLVGTPADAPARPKEAGGHLPGPRSPAQSRRGRDGPGGTGQDPGRTSCRPCPSARRRSSQQCRREVI